MTTHIVDEIPRLLSGEATRDVVQTAARHLRECEDCQQELVSAVVAHASLTSAHRFAPEIVAAIRDTPRVEQGNAPLPDLASLFAQVRDEAVTAPPSRRLVGRLGHRPLLVAASVAAALVVGGGAAVLVHDAGHTSTGRSVALEAFGSGHADAKATIDSHDVVKVNATSLPTLDAQHRYEVWLTNDARTEMQPVGWIGTNGTAQLTVPKALVQRYQDLEVSVQALDAPTYTYSGTSVLRGSYAA